MVQFGNLRKGSRVKGTVGSGPNVVPFDVKGWLNNLQVEISVERPVLDAAPAAFTFKASVTSNILKKFTENMGALIEGWDETKMLPSFNWNFGQAASAFNAPTILRPAHFERNEDVGDIASHAYMEPGTYTVTLLVYWMGRLLTESVDVEVGEATYTADQTFVVDPSGQFVGAPATARQYTDLSFVTSQGTLNGVTGDKLRILVAPGATITHTHRWNTDDVTKHIRFDCWDATSRFTLDMSQSRERIIEFSSNKTTGIQYQILNFDVEGNWDPTTEQRVGGNPLSKLVAFKDFADGNDVFIGNVQASGMHMFYTAGAHYNNPLAAKNGRISFYECAHDDFADFFFLGSSFQIDVGISIIGCRVMTPPDALGGGQTWHSYNSEDWGTYGSRMAHAGNRASAYRFFLQRSCYLNASHGWAQQGTPGATTKPHAPNGFRFNTGSEPNMVLSITKSVLAIIMASNKTSGDTPFRMFGHWEGNTIIRVLAAGHCMTLMHSGVVLRNNHFISPAGPRGVFEIDGFFGDTAIGDFPSYWGWKSIVESNTFEFHGSQADIGNFDPNDLFKSLRPEFKDTLVQRNNVVIAKNLDQPVEVDGPFNEVPYGFRYQRPGIALGWHSGRHTLTAEVPIGGTVVVPYAGQLDWLDRPVTAVDFAGYDGRASATLNGELATLMQTRRDVVGTIEVTVTPGGLVLTNNSTAPWLAGDTLFLNVSRGSTPEDPDTAYAVDLEITSKIPTPSSACYRNAEDRESGTLPYWDIDGNVRGDQQGSPGCFEPA